MKKKSINLNSTIKIRPYNVILDAVESGVGFGLNRAFKHTDKPTREGLQDCIESEVMGHLCDLFDFGDEE